MVYMCLYLLPLEDILLVVVLFFFYFIGSQVRLVTMVIQSSSRGDNKSTVTYVATEHGNQVLKGLQSLRKKRQLFDVTLVAEGQKFRAHRIVLASCCDYFRYSISLFMDTCVTPYSVISLTSRCVTDQH